MELLHEDYLYISDDPFSVWLRYFALDKRKSYKCEEWFQRRFEEELYWEIYFNMRWENK